MGFRKDSYATIWEIKPVSDTLTSGRISVSRKNKQTGEYETDFSGFVSFVGSVAAKNAMSLKEKDRIKLGDIDVTTKYDAEKKTTYTNYKVFSFETQNGDTQKNNANQSEAKAEGDVEIDDSQLPF